MCYRMWKLIKSIINKIMTNYFSSWPRSLISSNHADLECSFLSCPSLPISQANVIAQFLEASTSITSIVCLSICAFGIRKFNM